MTEEQFVNIDLNDDNVCSICKLGTERETLSFCHICFELSIEGKCNLISDNWKNVSLTNKTFQFPDYDGSP